MREPLEDSGELAGCCVYSCFCLFLPIAGEVGLVRYHGT
jgi:hypothetical protein